MTQESNKPVEMLADELEKALNDEWETSYFFRGARGYYVNPEDTMEGYLEITESDAKVILAALRLSSTPTAADRNAVLEEAGAWRPIETFDQPTARSSGNGVLVAVADGTVGEAYFRNFGDEDDGWWWANTSWGDYPEPDRPTPTHWRTLPDPPGALASAPPTAPADMPGLAADVVRLVIAAREVAFGGMFDSADPDKIAAIRELDQASEAFAERVPWDDDPEALDAE